jgi:hypothetical protein
MEGGISEREDANWGIGHPTCRAIILQLRSKALEVYPGYQQGGKGPSGSGHDVIDEGDEICQGESCWRGRGGGRSEEAVVVGLDKSDNEGGHSFCTEEL